jgi:hypothetical protein
VKKFVRSNLYLFGAALTKIKCDADVGKNYHNVIFLQMYSLSEFLLLFYLLLFGLYILSILKVNIYFLLSMFPLSLSSNSCPFLFSFFTCQLIFYCFGQHPFAFYLFYFVVFFECFFFCLYPHLIQQMLCSFFLLLSPLFCFSFCQYLPFTYSPNIYFLPSMFLLSLPSNFFPLLFSFFSPRQIFYCFVQHPLDFYLLILLSSFNVFSVYIHISFGIFRRQRFCFFFF